MTQRVFVTVLTLVGFLAGYAARVWTEPRRTVPAAPASIAQEYLHVSAPADGGHKIKAVDRAKLISEIERHRSQIEAYSAQVQELSNEFDREFVKILNPAQQEKFFARQKKLAEKEAKRVADRTPLSDEEIQRERERPLTDIYWMVTVTPSLEWRTREYGLDAQQQNATRALLTLRRNKFISLFDCTPHPSVRLSRLAPVIERMAPREESQPPAR